MFKILIIDDELLICKGLKSMIERCRNEQIGEVYYSTDPLAAIDMINDLKPEIIFTDIRMPMLNGLELIKKVALKENYRYRFIILSGYDDFAYVKESFMLGALDYLLKPIMIEELTEILNSAVNAIIEEEEKELHRKKLFSNANQAVMENRLNRIFSGVENSQGNLFELFTEMGIGLTYGYFCLGLTVFYGNTGREHKNNIQACLDSALINSTDDVSIYTLYDHDNNLVLLFNFDTETKKGIAAGFLSNFIKQLIDELQIVCSGSISDTDKISGDIQTLYKQAKKASAYRILFGPSQILQYSSIKNTKDKQLFYDRQLQNLKEYIATYQAKNTSNIIDELFDHNRLKNHSIQAIRGLYSAVLYVINDFAQDNNLNSIHNDYNDFYTFDYLSDIKIYLKTICFETISSLKDRSKNKTAADLAKKYIDDNYHSEIDMAVVSNMVSISYTHFSKLFKDEVGMNFSDYLTKVRMEKALELLNDPNNMIQDIAERVGYTNPKNFTRAFRNYFGFSPSQYRDRL